MPAVALIGTLDTKGDEIAYVRERLQALRVDVVVIDSGILGEPGCAPDFTHEEVAAAGDHTLAEIRGAGSRGAAVALMQDGVRALVVRLFAEGRVQGVLCLGGAEGALLGAAAMQALPGRRAEAAGLTVRVRPPHVRRVRRRERRVRDAFGGRHPWPERDLAPDLRQRRGGDGGHGPRRRLGARHARRALRRDHDAGPDDAGRDAAARVAGPRRPRAGDLPRQRRRRAGDGAPVRGGRAAGRRRLHAVRARQLADGRHPRDRPGAADRRRAAAVSPRSSSPAASTSSTKARATPFPSSTARARATSTTPSRRWSGSSATRRSPSARS